jgi:CheY-like chemotaxis protein
LKNSRPLELATRQAKVIGRLLDDLLDVARFANGKVTVEKRNVALSSAIHDAIEACGRNMQQKRQHFTYDLSRDVVVYGDPIRLTQLFSNLLVNASKYTPEGGHISLDCDVHESTVDVSITDNGIGMTPELLARLFEPFAQGEQSIERSDGGLGLGLALAKSIAELHAGSISASSMGIGCGSEFTVSLPVTSGEARETQAEPASIDAHHTSLRIMLAEDDADSAETLEALLSNGGYEVHTVRDGRTAIAAASVFRPQVVLLDIGLPEMNGYELAQELRKSIAGDERPLLVALSGYGRLEDLQRSRAAGIDHHLVKPLQMEKLERILTDYQSSRHRSSLRI